MVVFTCSYCGDSFSKPKAEKHYYTKCNNKIPNLSCVDCFKDFYGNEYIAHTKCITEEERYSAKGFVPKMSKNKGERKQNSWLEMIQEVLRDQPNVPNNVIMILKEISNHANIPRKKEKFMNFSEGISRKLHVRRNDIEKAWDLISVKLTELSAKNQLSKAQVDKNQPDDDNHENCSDNIEEMKNLNLEKDNGIKKKKVKSITLPDQQCDQSLTDAPVEEPNENKEDNNGLKKKKKKVKSISLAEDDQQCDQSLTDAPVEEPSENKEDLDKDKNPKTKKERKEEKKKKKYEAELQHAAEPKPEEDDDNNEDDGGKGKKRKRTKSHKDENINGVIDSKEEKKLKKNKHRTKSETNGFVEDGAVPENELNGNPNHILNEDINDEETTKPGKFNWENTIISLLKSKSNEMPFKRLHKKVLAEYMEVTGEVATDRIVNKLHKKMRSMANVTVDGDRVMLNELATE